MTLTQVKADFDPLTQKQLLLIHQLNENNTTQDQIVEITQKQEALYKEAWEKVFIKKKLILRQPLRYPKELLLLEKSIKRNKLRNNTYAVLRDEVLMKSYQILQEQDKLLKHILRAVDIYDSQEFNKDMNEMFVKNQVALEKIDSEDYRPYLDQNKSSAIFHHVKKNIKDYYAIKEMNLDKIKYFSIFEQRLYRLNKYKNYHILQLALFLDHSEIGQKLNPILYQYQLSIVKLLVIIVISLFIYLFRKQFYKIIGYLLGKIKYFKKYNQAIMNDLHTTLNVLFIFINLHIIIHIYHNFDTLELHSKLFNITYSVLFCFILYRIFNTVAAISIQDIGENDLKIKSEMVNVGLKIMNFIILIIAVLLIMHFAGANLTAILSGLGIGGFAVAFAAKETLANFLGTISILMSDIFSQGDWIAVDDKEGTVTEIGLRVTTLRTFENGLISIPNGAIANKDVINWSRRKLGRRIKMSVGVKYDSKAENIHNAIEEIREMLKHHPNIATGDTNYDIDRPQNTKLVSKEDSLGVKRVLHVYLNELADSSINILVYCFSKNTAFESWLETKEEIIYNIMGILEKNDLEFAYPSMSLYHENKV